MREHSRIHVRLDLHMIGLTSRNIGFCRLDSKTERQVMRRVTVQTNLPIQLGLEQHRVKDILCVLGPLRSQQANYNNP